MSDSDTWHVVKRKTGECEIVSGTELATSTAEQWGPFSSKQEAIARRVGLIRTGKCKPVLKR
jgi:hypothetical protein